MLRIAHPPATRIYQWHNSYQTARKKRMQLCRWIIAPTKRSQGGKWKCPTMATKHPLHPCTQDHMKLLKITFIFERDLIMNLLCLLFAPYQKLPYIQERTKLHNRILILKRDQIINFFFLYLLLLLHRDQHQQQCHPLVRQCHCRIVSLTALLIWHLHRQRLQMR